MKQNMLMLGLILLSMMGCRDKSKDENKPVSNNPVEAGPISHEPVTLFHQKTALMVQYNKKAPGLADAAIDQRCEALEGYLKGMQTEVFPELNFHDMSCKDGSLSSAIVYYVSFDAEHAGVTEKFRFDCSQLNSQVSWWCGSTSNVAFKPGVDPTLAVLDNMLSLESSEFAQKASTLPPRIFGETLPKFVESLSAKAEIGLDFVEFQHVKGFESGDSILVVALIPDEGGDSSSGRAEFKHVPDFWFKIRTTELFTFSLLLDCQDMECLQSARYDIRGKNLVFSRPSSSMHLSYPLEATNL